MPQTDHARAAENCRNAEISRYFRSLLKATGLVAYATTLRRGLQTRIAEGGIDLPAGIRQRLQIARSTLDRPRILLIDDADAFHDPAARSAIRALLRTGGRTTTIVVTRDPELQALASAIWTLESGRLIIGPATTLSAGDVPADRVGGNTAAGANVVPLRPAPPSVAGIGGVA